MFLVNESKMEAHERGGEGDAQPAVNVARVNDPHMTLEIIRSHETSQAVMRVSKAMS